MILLKEFNDSEDTYNKLYYWCSNKNVYEWFEQRLLTYDEIVSKYKKKLLDKKQDLYIINYNNKDIGLVQIYKYEDDINLNYNNTYEYDLFIGDTDYLNKGIGKEIVELINNLIYTKYKSDYIILRPFKRNIRAIKCYQKCGFKIIKEYKGKDTLGSSEDIVVLINSR